MCEQIRVSRPAALNNSSGERARVWAERVHSSGSFKSEFLLSADVTVLSMMVTVGLREIRFDCISRTASES